MIVPLLNAGVSRSREPSGTAGTSRGRTYLTPTGVTYVRNRAVPEVRLGSPDLLDSASLSSIIAA
jgi:hypothetical protein